MGCLPILSREGSTLLADLDNADYALAGLPSFMQEYVITRAIPIPELLCAFDFYLVRTRTLNNTGIFNAYD